MTFNGKIFSKLWSYNLYITRLSKSYQVRPEKENKTSHPSKPEKVIKSLSSPFTTKSSCSWDTWTRLCGTTPSFSSSSSTSNDATSCWKKNLWGWIQWILYLIYIMWVHVMYSMLNKQVIYCKTCSSLFLVSAHFPWNNSHPVVIIQYMHVSFTSLHYMWCGYALFNEILWPFRKFCLK